MGEFQEQVQEFLDRVMDNRNKPKSPRERRKEIHKRLKNERDSEKGKYGL